MNGQWYFTTREGDMGPFRTRVVALKEVHRFVRESEELNHFQQSRLKQPLDGDLMVLPLEDERALSL